MHAQALISLSKRREAKVVQPLIPVYADHRGRRYHATYDPITRKVMLNDGRDFAPSGAAKAIAGHELSGWKFWHLEDGRSLGVLKPTRAETPAPPVQNSKILRPRVYLPEGHADLLDKIIFETGTRRSRTELMLEALETWFQSRGYSPRDWHYEPKPREPRPELPKQEQYPLVIVRPQPAPEQVPKEPVLAAPADSNEPSKEELEDKARKAWVRKYIRDKREGRAR